MRSRGGQGGEPEGGRLAWDAFLAGLGAVALDAAVGRGSRGRGR